MAPKTVLLIWLTAVAFLWGVDNCMCFSNGSVAFSCGHMMPGHSSYTASSSSPPFSVSSSSATYNPGGVITVTVETVANHPAEFQGFLLQARSTQLQATLWPVGRFTNLDPAQFTALDCNTMKDSAVSQATGSKKKKVQLTWQAPSDNSSGDVYFSVSVVQNYTTFWVQLNSSTVRVNSFGTSVVSSSSSALLLISMLILCSQR